MSIALPGNTPNIAGSGTTPSGGSYTIITSTHVNTHGAAVAYGLNTNFSGTVSQADWQNIVNTAKAENNRRSGTALGGTITTTLTIKAGSCMDQDGSVARGLCMDQDGSVKQGTCMDQDGSVTRG